MIEVFQLGGALVEVGDKETVTTFADGSFIRSSHAEQGGQQEVAARLGITVEAMNREHDLAHCVLAAILRQHVSPTLHAIAHGRVWSMWWREEAAVLELQGLVPHLGTSITEIARLMHKEQSHG